MPRLRRLLYWSQRLALILAAGLAPRSGCAFQENRVMVVSVSGIRPIEEAVHALRESLVPITPVSIDLKSPSGSAELLESLRTAPPRIIVAVGMEALKTVAANPSPVPILATMILRSDGAGILAEAAVRRRVAAVYLDVAIADVALELRVLFPDKHRLGTIRNLSREGDLQTSLRQPGITVEAKPCGGPEELLRTFLSFKRKVDFVLLSPDSRLYNEATVKPLILASLANQLPIIGFSASFVRSGAAIGIYPEFRDVGLQTGDAVRRFLAAPAAFSDEAPHKLTVGLNPQVLRLLGLEPRPAAGHTIVSIK